MCYCAPVQPVIQRETGAPVFLTRAMCDVMPFSLYFLVFTSLLAFKHQRHSLQFFFKFPNQSKTAHFTY